MPKPPSPSPPPDPDLNIPHSCLSTLKDMGFTNSDLHLLASSSDEENAPPTPLTAAEVEAQSRAFRYVQTSSVAAKLRDALSRISPSEGVVPLSVLPCSAPASSKLTSNSSSKPILGTVFAMPQHKTPAEILAALEPSPNLSSVLDIGGSGDKGTLVGIEGNFWEPNLATDGNETEEEKDFEGEDSRCEGNFPVQARKYLKDLTISPPKGRDKRGRGSRGKPQITQPGLYAANKSISGSADPGIGAPSLIQENRGDLQQVNTIISNDGDRTSTPIAKRPTLALRVAPRAN